MSLSGHISILDKKKRWLRYDLNNIIDFYSFLNKV